MVSQTIQERSCRRVTAIRPTMPAAPAHTPSSRCRRRAVPFATQRPALQPQAKPVGWKRWLGRHDVSHFNLEAANLQYQRPTADAHY